MLPGKHCILKALWYYEKTSLFTKTYNVYWKKTPFGQYLLFIFISSTPLTCKSPWLTPEVMAWTSGGHCDFWCWWCMFRMSLRKQNQTFASNNVVVFSYCYRQIDTPLSPLFRADFPAVMPSWSCHWQCSFSLRLPEASIEGHVPTHTSEFTNELDFMCWCSDTSAEVEGYQLEGHVYRISEWSVLLDWDDFTGIVLKSILRALGLWFPVVISSLNPSFVFIFIHCTWLTCIYLP